MTGTVIVLDYWSLSWQEEADQPTLTARPRPTATNLPTDSTDPDWPRRPQLTDRSTDHDRSRPTLTDRPNGRDYRVRKLLHSLFQTSADRPYQTITNCRTQCCTQWCTQWPTKLTKTNKPFFQSSLSLLNLSKGSFAIQFYRFDIPAINKRRAARSQRVRHEFVYFAVFTRAPHWPKVSNLTLGTVSIRARTRTPALPPTSNFNQQIQIQKYTNTNTLRVRRCTPPRSNINQQKY